MKLTIEIETDNAAFYESGTRVELRRILKEAVEQVSKNDEGSIRDINGNRVGQWEWK